MIGLALDLLELPYEPYLMPIISARKIIQVGGSKSVSLPPGWLDAAGLDLGDQILLVADGVILIAPKGTRLEPKQLYPLIEVINRGVAE
jgi:antitoxin component of MazEF toxin-antitoxin module